MQLDSLLGNAEATAALKQALAGGRLPHAVLLTGADGCGRGFAARCLAADYLFPNGGPGADAVLRNESSEVLLVTGEGKSGQIPVDRIRAVRQDIFLSALSAAGRVVWIRDAHRMAAPAANALLKVLEEPPAQALFILTARDASSLPLTIQSRCALYPLAPVPLAKCEGALRAALPPGANAALPAKLAAVYAGRIGMGLRALQNPERLAVLTDALAAATAAGSANRYQLLRLFAAYEGRADGDRDKRDALLADMTDALAACLRGEAAAAGLPALPRAAAARMLPAVAAARQSLQANGAPKLVFTTLAIHLAGATAQTQPQSHAQHSSEPVFTGEA